jgi:ABC-type nickel/cobalt efflux system permease component RcnA
MRRSRRLVRAAARAAVRAAAAALLLVPLTSAVAFAHPLGNFTINHYAGIRVEPDRVLLDVVIDEAEIPTFQATAGLDRDGDGRLSPAETAGVRQERCLAIGGALTLAIDGAAARLELIAAGAAFPEGNGGLPTMRISCVFRAPITAPSGGVARIDFRDAFEPARIGWREITAVGDRVTAEAPGIPSTSASARLTAYPTGLSAAPDVREASMTVRPGGPALPAFFTPDATPIGPLVVGVGGAAGPVGSVGDAPTEASAPSAVRAPAVGAAVPGGADALPSILRQAPLSPILALVAFMTAVLLGAGHAVTPGHGKTLMAAYLVGTRGTPRHAIGLGLAVSVSHTAGILALAIVILAAESTLPADAVVRLAPLVAAVAIVLIGAWMLAAELRRRRAARRTAALAAHDHDGSHAHEHEDGHGHTDGHAEGEAGHEHRPGDAGHEHMPGRAGEHRHGPMSHRHAPASGTTVTWRGLFLLGLAGGLIPSANALLILLGTIAAGRPAWGVVLVGAFGLGMAAVMAAVGLASVYARGLAGRLPRRLPVGAASRLVPLGASVLVLAIGIVLTTQALAAVQLG